MPTAEELFAEEAIRDAHRRDDGVIFEPVTPGTASGCWIVPGSILRHVHMGDSFVCVGTRGGVPVVQREYTVNNPSEWLLVGRVNLVSGSKRIDTYEGAIEEMLRWANGEKSHWNAYAALLGPSTAEAIASATTACHQADAAEVQKWAAVVGALRSAEGSASVHTEAAVRLTRENQELREALAIQAQKTEEVRAQWGKDASEFASLKRELEERLAEAPSGE